MENNDDNNEATGSEAVPQPRSASPLPAEEREGWDGRQESEGRPGGGGLNPAWEPERREGGTNAIKMSQRGAPGGSRGGCSLPPDLPTPPRNPNCGEPGLGWGSPPRDAAGGGSPGAILRPLPRPAGVCGCGAEPATPPLFPLLPLFAPPPRPNLHAPLLAPSLPHVAKRGIPPDAPPTPCDAPGAAPPHWLRRGAGVPPPEAAPTPQGCPGGCAVLLPPLQSRPQPPAPAPAPNSQLLAALSPASLPNVLPKDGRDPKGGPPIPHTVPGGFRRATMLLRSPNDPPKHGNLSWSPHGLSFHRHLHTSQHTQRVTWCPRIGQSFWV